MIKRKGWVIPMLKYTQKELRKMVQTGMAIDITNADPNLLPTKYEKIGYSTGDNGMNGGLIQEIDSGRYYVIIGRTSTLFYLM